MKAARRADAEDHPHQEPEIEATRVDEQALEHVLVAAYVDAAEAARFVEMRARPFQQLAPSSQEAFAAIPADASSIGVDRLAFGPLP